MKTFSSACMIAVLSTFAAGSIAADPFERSIRPLLHEYCVTCHSTQEQQGELDLQRFDSLDQVKRHADIWKQVQEQVDLGEMPPKDAKQLSAEQKRLLLGWVRSTLNEIALANAGDPGPVVLRRLSNHEYTYTLRDLTGVPSLDPAREFPVDGAAGEGFTNVGSALVMSPALLSKYLEAAKEVSRHLVLLEDGIRFSPSDSPQDWTDEDIGRPNGPKSWQEPTLIDTSVLREAVPRSYVIFSHGSGSSPSGAPPRDPVASPMQGYLD